MSQILRGFNASVKVAQAEGMLGDVDKALIETGRTLAKEIDAAAKSGEGKGLYMAPYFTSVLKELLLTPAERERLGKTKIEPLEGALGKLRAIHGGKKSS